jgi:hypothetical protein
MKNFDLDLADLNQVMRTDRIPVAGNEHRMIRIAFDLFRLEDDGEHLWQVQADDDGNEFLARTYDLPKEEGEVVEAAEKSEWAVTADNKYANLTVSYKGMPIHKLAVSDYGAEGKSDVKMLQDLVMNKLADTKWVTKFIKSLPEEKRSTLAEISDK